MFAHQITLLIACHLGYHAYSTVSNPLGLGDTRCRRRESKREIPNDIHLVFSSKEIGMVWEKMKFESIGKWTRMEIAMRKLLLWVFVWRRFFSEQGSFFFFFIEDLFEGLMYSIRQRSKNFCFIKERCSLIKFLIKNEEEEDKEDSSSSCWRCLRYNLYWIVLDSRG